MRHDRLGVLHNWEPVLRGAEADKALAIAKDVADALLLEWQSRSHVPGLSGLAGYALTFFYLGRHLGDKRYIDTGNLCHELALEQVGQLVTPTSLYGGWVGALWVSEHVLLSEPGYEVDVNADADRALLEAMSSGVVDYDLINGLVGLGVLALERARRTTDYSIVRRIIDSLENLSEECSPGARWLTHPSVLPIFTRRLYPGGYYNLGVAHGVPGVVAFLARAVDAAEHSNPKALRLLNEAAAWVLSCALPESPLSLLPCWHAPNEVTRGGRSAWCYGDAGVAACLLSAQRWLVDGDLLERSRLLAQRAALLPVEGSGVRDAGLCHGSSGLGLIFARLYNSTRHQVFADAARRWYGVAMEQHRPGTGLGGYQFWTPQRDHRTRLPSESPPMGWAADPEFLAGSSGVALSLLSASTDCAPQWDRLLLLS